MITQPVTNLNECGIHAYSEGQRRSSSEYDSEESLPIAELCDDATTVIVTSDVHIEVSSDIERGVVTTIPAIRAFDDYESRQQTCVRALIAFTILSSAISGFIYGIIR